MLIEKYKHSFPEIDIAEATELGFVKQLEAIRQWKIETFGE